MGAFTALFNNPNNIEGNLQLFASTDKEGFATNQYGFPLPYTATYPIGTKVEVVSNGVSYSIVTSAVVSREGMIALLQGLGIADAWKLDPSILTNTYYAYSNTNVFTSMEISYIAGGLNTGNIFVNPDVAGNGAQVALRSTPSNLYYLSADGSNFVNYSTPSFPSMNNNRSICFPKPFDRSLSNTKGIALGLAGADNIVALSNDSGNSFVETIDPSTVSYYAISKYQKNVNKAILLRAGVGGGIKWIDLTTGISTDINCPFDLKYTTAFDQWNDDGDIDNNEQICAMDSTNKIWYTSDGGTTWIDISGTGTLLDPIYSNSALVGTPSTKAYPLIQCNIENGQKVVYFGYTSATYSYIIKRNITLNTAWEQVFGQDDYVLSYFCVDFQNRNPYVYAYYFEFSDQAYRKLYNSLNGGTDWSLSILPASVGNSASRLSYIGQKIYILNGSGNVSIIA